ncbi:hypothetical protein FQA47_010401 [Oryzias melastigma]|uniref:Uncharacterized protein n=1 Tax=Oryzias melastigma TaxID=30732 RepID=A0A834CLM0_ORYME|nr:hypothetical protein FQA47_010401 [Oryzias melastigma]
MGSASRLHLSTSSTTSFGVQTAQTVEQTMSSVLGQNLECRRADTLTKPRSGSKGKLSGMYGCDGGAGAELELSLELKVARTVAGRLEELRRGGGAHLASLRRVH